MVGRKAGWLLFLSALSGCGEDDDMSTRQFKSVYGKPYQAARLVDTNISVGKDHNLINACLDNYSKSRRNILAVNYNVSPSLVDVFYAYGSTGVRKFLTIPIGNRIRPFGTVKVWFRSWVLTGGANYVDVFFTLGKLVSSTTRVNWTAAAWSSVTFTIEKDSITRDDVLTINGSGNNDWFVGGSISVYQLGAASGVWVDLTSANCKIGTADFPVDAYALKLLSEKIEQVHQYKLPANNIYNHWWTSDPPASSGQPYKTGAFSANTDRLGRYKIIKRRGVSTLRVLVLQTSTGGGNWTIKSTIGAVAHNTVVAGTSGVLTHTALTDHVYAGADITNELELEFKIDAEDTSTTAGVMGVYGVEIVEMLGTPVAHTVPTLDDINHRRPILASTINNIRNTCSSLWADAGRQIVMSDWRFNEAFDTPFYCTATAESKITYNDDACVVARALAYFSTGSARVRVSFGFHTTAGSDYYKYIKFAIAQTAVAAEEDTGPGVGQMFQFKDAIENGVYVIQDELTIPQDHLNSTTDTWIWVLAWTENVAEYIIPDWVTIEEVALAQTEFP